MKIFQPILALLLPLKAMACGLDWSPPVSHFENVDSQGNVHIVRKLSEVGDLPIYLIFNSSYSVSPYAGSGFEIPLLESKICQVDENRFLMKSPSGRPLILQRTKIPEILNGPGDIKGLIRENLITVWTNCGDKIIFKNGKIVFMQIAGKAPFTYSYKGNRLEGIEQNGQFVLKVETNGPAGDVSGITLPSSREQIVLQQTEMLPNIGNIAGKNIVSRMDKTLSQATRPDKSRETFAFGVDENVNPTVTLGSKKLTWNPATGKVLSDGEWKYEIKSGSDQFDNSSISRTNSTGQEESWYLDMTKSEEVFKKANGTTTRRSWFTSGVLAGHLRKIETSSPQGKDSETYVYNEMGKAVRKVTNNSIEYYSHDGDGLVVDFSYNGVPYFHDGKILATSTTK
jgi:hypothetical protein